MLNNPLVLMEAAVVERLRRSGTVQLHDTLANAPLIYDPIAAEVMGAIYSGYIALARRAGLPMFVCTPTWRANRARVEESGASGTINPDAVSYMQRLCDADGPDDGGVVKIGGMLGCRNDCYRPDEGLSAADAERFHGWQIDQLAKGGVDFLIAETLPNVHEALGIARAMGRTGLPYIISFVIARNGRILDGTTLDAAFDTIDAHTAQPPLGYMVNCAHPSFLCPYEQPPGVFSRLMGYQANASALDHCDLDGAEGLEADSVSEWGRLMLELNHVFGVQILGGCCGTGEEHLEYLVENRGT